MLVEFSIKDLIEIKKFFVIIMTLLRVIILQGRSNRQRPSERGCGKTVNFVNSFLPPTFLDGKNTVKKKGRHG